MQLTIASVFRIAEQHLRSGHVEHWVRYISYTHNIFQYRILKDEYLGFSPYPLAIPRFITMTCLLFHACKTGIPAIGDPGSSAIGFTVSLAPITRVTSVSPKSSLISSISSTTAHHPPSELFAKGLGNTHCRTAQMLLREGHCIAQAYVQQPDE